MNPSPRQRFLALNGNEWEKISNSPLFQEAIDAATLEHIERKNNQGDDGLYAFHQIQGAKEVLRILKNLGSTVEVEKPKDTSRLNFETK